MIKIEGKGYDANEAFEELKNNMLSAGLEYITDFYPKRSKNFKLESLTREGIAEYQAKINEEQTAEKEFLEKQSFWYKFFNGRGVDMGEYHIIRYKDLKGETRYSFLSKLVQPNFIAINYIEYSFYYRL